VAQSVNEELIKKVNIFWVEFNSLKELDSIQKQAPQSEKMPAFNYWVVKGIYSNRKQYTRRASRKVLKILLHNLPKVLFLFMPFSPLIFGFSTKKRWYYFDHGILHFTIFRSYY
jgi:hypothetical protein